MKKIILAWLCGVAFYGNALELIEESQTKLLIPDNANIISYVGTENNSVLYTDSNNYLSHYVIDTEENIALNIECRDLLDIVNNNYAICQNIDYNTQGGGTATQQILAVNLQTNSVVAVIDDNFLSVDEIASIADCASQTCAYSAKLLDSKDNNVLISKPYELVEYNLSDNSYKTLIEVTPSTFIDEALYTDNSLYFKQHCSAQDAYRLGYLNGNIGDCSISSISFAATIGEYLLLPTLRGYYELTDITNTAVFKDPIRSSVLNVSGNRLTTVDYSISNVTINSLSDIEVESYPSNPYFSNGLSLEIGTDNIFWSDDGAYFMGVMWPVDDSDPVFSVNSVFGDYGNISFPQSYPVVSGFTASGQAIVITSDNVATVYSFKGLGNNKLNNYTGTWFDADNPGQGMFIEVIEREYYPTGATSAGLSLAWYTFDNTGNPLWLVGSSNNPWGTSDRGYEEGVPNDIRENCLNQSNYNQFISVYSVSGGDFGIDFDPLTKEVQNRGGLILCFNNNEDKLYFSYQDNGDYSYLVSGGTSYSGIFTRLTQIDGMDDASATIVPWNSTETGGAVLSNVHSGSWFNPEQGGAGLYLEVIQREGEQHGVNMSWYANRNGEPFYLIGSQNGLTYSDNTVSVPMYEVSGAKFGDEFDSTDVVKTEWGTMTLTVKDCNNITLNYDGLDGQGEIALTRLTFIKELTCTE